LASADGFLQQFELPEALCQQILAHVLRCLPEEACGLVGSQREDRQAAAVIPIENELHSPVSFRMAPAEQLKAFYWLDEHHLELAAIFHSHPRGPHHPSPTDLAEFAYPGVLLLILSPLDLASPLDAAANWQIRGYRIDGGLSSQLTANEVTVVCNPASNPGQT